MDLSGVAGKKIALGVCGGIAAYKVVELARDLTKAGASVHVLMTPSATNFVGPITFSTLTNNAVRTELFPEVSPSEIPHTDLARTSDIIVIAPATAKTIAKFAQGLSDDLISALLLSAKGPIVMAPAMHTEMWENEGTQQNIKVLGSRGVRIVGPESGALAGPDVGIGRLAAIDHIEEAIIDELSRTNDCEGMNILVTAGGTQEPIDAVRFIGNRSSGRMGYEIAAEALRRGGKVTLITAPTSLVRPIAADVVEVMTAAQMREATTSAATKADVVVMAAAVADFRPSESKHGKLKKSAGLDRIPLEPTVDILEELGRSKPPGQMLVGFAAETEDVVANARMKLTSKGCDVVVANLVGVADSGFDTATNKAWILSAAAEQELPLMSKKQLARALIDVVVRGAQPHPN